ncbi:MAG: hypothetical protein ABSF45_19790 [Terriglobia bacterium]
MPNRREFILGTAGTGMGLSQARLPAEWKALTDPETGRKIKQLTSAPANSYPLYYFSPSVTADSRYLVLHSERSGWVELYRLDLTSGDIVQLTDGRTRESGWAIWCEPHLRGIYNHLSALNVAKREVYYFQDSQIRRVDLETLTDTLVHDISGRLPIGQSMFSPDGHHFAFIHVEGKLFLQAFSDREALENMKLFGQTGHQQWRNSVPTTIGAIDTETDKYFDVIQLPYHVHHVLFADNSTLLVNHIQNANGMWMVRLDGTGLRILRPPDQHGSLVHQVVTQRGIFYEAAGSDNGKKTNWLGRYDLAHHTFEEVPLPVDGYVHTGFDPAGRFLFFENHGETHELMSLHFPFQAGRTYLRKLRTMAKYPRPGQRYHAHPFLSPDRRWLIYTEPINEISQVCALDVRDLVDLDEYWEFRP